MTDKAIVLKSLFVRDLHYNLTVSQGEYVALTGASGSGKTTLLSLLALLASPDSGTFHLWGQDTTQMSEQQKTQVRCHNIGVLFQNYPLLAHHNVLENILLPLHYTGGCVQQGQEYADYLLSQFQLKQKANSYPRQLSGGQQQRIALARALITQPKLLLADEPTSALDQDLSQRVFHAVREIATITNMTVLWVTHDQSLSQQCDRHYDLDHSYD